MARIAVVGAGIAGLAAAWEIERLGHEAVVFDAASRPGGKLQRSAVPGLDFTIDDGADAFLARVPDALELCAEIGLDDLVNPARTNAFVYARGALRPLPSSQLLGVPTDLDDVAASGLVSADGIAIARADLTADHAPVSADLSVGELIRGRLGDEVCDHLVEPLLGGINGGEADGLSTEAAAAQLWACARAGGSLVRAAADLKSRAVVGAPVFATPITGMATLPDALLAALRTEVRTGHRVAHVVRTGRGMVVDGVPVDGAVLATPADVMGRLLADLAPQAATTLADTEFSSVVMVTLVLDRATLDHPLDGSGLVVDRTAGRAITAASWGSSKWPQWSDGTHAVLRVSLGHDGDARDWCAYDDDALVDVVVEDLALIMDTVIRPVGTRVRRWAHSFPQYRPGHLDRVRAVRTEVHAAAPIRLAGMSLDGIGVPACIRAGRIAARDLLDG